MTVRDITIGTPSPAIIVAAPYAPAALIVSTTSDSTATIGVGGAYTFVVNDTGLGFTAGMRVRAAAQDDPTQWIEGTVTSFDQINLVIDSDLFQGTGIFTGWNVALAGQPGQKGDTGATGAVGPQGPPGGLNNPNVALTGTPTCPVAGVADSSQQIANTQWVRGTLTANYQPLDSDLTSLAAAATVGDIYYRSAAGVWNPVIIGTNLTFTGGTLAASLSGTAPINSPVFTGDPQAPTPAPGDNDTSIATTAFVTAAVAPKAPLASPALTGTPTAPTPAAADNSTTIATTAYVTGKLATGYQPLDNDLTSLAAFSASGVLVYRNAAGDWRPVVMGSNMGFDAATGTLSAAGTGGGGGIAEAPNDGVLYGRRSLGWQQAVSPTDLAAYAKLASPSFSGTPLAPTAAAGTNNQQIATTAFVEGEIANNLVTYAPLASPVLTGDPRAPTPSAGDNDTSIATTAFVQNAIAPLAPLASPTFTGDPKAPTPAANDNDTSIATTAFVKSQNYAPLASPALIGTPTAPTAPLATATTQIATTGFVRTGVTDGSAAAAGMIGEEIRAASSQFALGGNAWASATNITLTPGEWEVTGFLQWWLQSGASSAWTVIQGCISQTANAQDALADTLVSNAFVVPQIYVFPTCPVLVRTTANKVLWPTLWHNNTTDPIVVNATIRARRMR